MDKLLNKQREFFQTGKTLDLPMRYQPYKRKRYGRLIRLFLR